jgi:hypothetical protein
MSAKFSLNKKMRTQVKRRLPANYRRTAKAAFKAALDGMFGSHGAASPVRRIDPKTGELIEADRSADDIRRSMGLDLAARL